MLQRWPDSQDFLWMIWRTLGLSDVSFRVSSVIVTSNILLFLALGDGVGFEVKVVSSKGRHLKSFLYPPHVTFLL